MKFSKFLTGFCFFICISVGIQAQTHIWTGAGADNSWFTAANWDVGTIPSISSDVLIPNASEVEITTAIASVHSITLSGNSTLQIANNLSISDQLIIPPGSNIVWLSNEINGGGTIYNDGLIQLESFNEKMLNNTTINNNGAIYITNTNINRASNGAIINNNASGFIEINSVGGWIQSEPGCTINNAGLITKINDNGTFSTFYLIFDIHNSGTIRAEENQTFLILGGSIVLDNQVTGVISGSGIFDITADFTNAGTFSPGGILGTGTLEVVNNFSFPTNSVLELDIEGPNPGEYDVAAIFGFPVLEGTIAIDLHYEPELGDEFEVITANSITTCILAESTTAVYDGVEYTFLIECNSTNVTLRVSESTLGLSNFVSEHYEFSIYPNPVNETINVSFNASEGLELPSESLSLTIYNILGQEVKAFTNFSEEKRSFERGNLTSGMYFLQLTSGSKILATTKMIVI